MNSDSQHERPPKWLPFHEALQKIKCEHNQKLVEAIKNSKPPKPISLREAAKMLDRNNYQKRVSRPKSDNIPEFEDGYPRTPNWV